MEVIANGKNSLPGRTGRHGERLKALAVTERVGDSGKACAVAADKACKRAVRPISCVGDVLMPFPLSIAESVRPAESGV